VDRSAEAVARLARHHSQGLCFIEHLYRRETGAVLFAERFDDVGDVAERIAENEIICARVRVKF
jgi:hypothetical protein